MTEVNFTVDSSGARYAGDEKKPLLWVLREDLGQTQTKFGCGAGLCGACSVYVDDKLVRSCVLPISTVQNKVVRTISGLDDELGQRLKAAWERFEVAQCGYCQPGFILASHRLLSQTPPGQSLKWESISNLCRCATYERMRRAIEAVHAERPSP